MIHAALAHLSEGFKHAIDALSIGVALGAVAQVLPSVASVMTVIWLGIRIYESKTFGRLIGRRQQEITPSSED